ncbi:flagellar hook-basal body complex protein [Pararhodobacter sp. SW119]|uniref:flagellar hook-basal body complex protein n=1 Tax=Pararhodobacter sp. SW119 TaxID=2780075 RepID=UPI001ADF48F9|nr:flagellar hook-basal body complex protein [Pararhodobacter sp. SW119]
MDNAGYTGLTRQSGLLRELQLLANNMANVSTTGFRREGVLFSEFVRRLDPIESPLSMAAANARQTFLTQGTLTQTGGALDLAIEGDGYFQVETPQGERLTRAGHFQTNAEGEMVTPDGYPLLDLGGARIFVPADAGVVAIARDGTLSVDGAPLAQIGLVRPADPTEMRRAAGVLLEPVGDVLPAEQAVVYQGFLEESNVNPITEMARLVAVQRAYELGQSFMDREDERIRNVVQTLGR